MKVDRGCSYIGIQVSKTNEKKEEIVYANNMVITAGQPAPYGQEIFDYFKDKSYGINDLIWQDPVVQQHDLSLSGGTEAITYFMLLGYHTEEGSYKNLGYDRYKFIVQVLIGERRDQGVYFGTRCFWDANTDNQASETFTNVGIHLLPSTILFSNHLQSTICTM